MKNILIVIIILTIVGGVMLFFGKGKKAEAPTQVDKNEESGVVSSGMPALDAPETEEKSVIDTSGQVDESVVVKEFVITGQNFSFAPSVLTVKKGDRIKITFKNSSGFHNFVIDEYGVATKQTASPTTEVLEFTADKVGSFEYYCSVGTHRAMGMKGTLVVN